MKTFNLTNLFANQPASHRAHESWQKMKGGQKVRICSVCQQRIYNLTAMDSREALRQIKAGQGNSELRGQFFRPDSALLLYGEKCTAHVPAQTRAATRGLLRAAAQFVAAAVARLRKLFVWQTAAANAVRCNRFEAACTQSKTLCPGL